MPSFSGCGPGCPACQRTDGKDAAGTRDELCDRGQGNQPGHGLRLFSELSARLVRGPQSERQDDLAPGELGAQPAPDPARRRGAGEHGDDGRTAGEEARFRWSAEAVDVGFITDLEICSETAAEIARIGRSRWKIENDVFKTLKSDEGVRRGKNYRHGRNHSMDVLTLRMLMAFQFDLLQAVGSTEFQEARARKQGRLSYLWRAMAEKVRGVPLESWSMLFGLIGHPERYILFESLARPSS